MAGDEQVCSVTMKLYARGKAGLAGEIYKGQHHRRVIQLNGACSTTYSLLKQYLP